MSKIFKELAKKYTYSGYVWVNVLLVLIYQISGIMVLFYNYSFLTFAIPFILVGMNYNGIYADIQKDLYDFDFVYAPLGSKKRLIEEWTVLVFMIPIIGPIIAYLRILKLEKELEKREKKNN